MILDVEQTQKNRNIGVNGRVAGYLVVARGYGEKSIVADKRLELSVSTSKTIQTSVVSEG